MLVSAPFRCAKPATPKPKVAPRKPRERPQTALPALGPPWNVILLDDPYHTFEYVIEMLHAVFGHSPVLGLRMAEEVNNRGRVVVATVHKELAELKKQQIEDYGPDPYSSDPQAQKSMRAEIEPCLS